MTQRFSKLLHHRSIPLLAVVLMTVLLWQLFITAAYGAELSDRSMKMSSSVASATATYQLGFDISTAGPLGSISIQYCSNSPIFPDPCVAPAGMSLAGVALTDQTGETGFSLAPNPAGNELLLSRSVAPSAVGPVTYTLTNAVNPNAIGSYYVRMQTYATSDASGPATDFGAIAFAINNDLSVTAEVPPYLIFCAALTIPILDCASAEGNYINFGELSSTRPSFGTSQVLSASNAKDGYNVTLDGITMTSGNNEITALIAADASRPGTPQFGMNLRANASPSGGSEPDGPGVGAPLPGYNTANFFKFVAGDIVISTDKPDEMRRYTASYLVNVPRTQPAGVYVSTVTYICLGNF